MQSLFFILLCIHLNQMLCYPLCPFQRFAQAYPQIAFLPKSTNAVCDQLTHLSDCFGRFVDLNCGLEVVCFFKGLLECDSERDFRIKAALMHRQLVEAFAGVFRIEKGVHSPKLPTTAQIRKIVKKLPQVSNNLNRSSRSSSRSNSNSNSNEPAVLWMRDWGKVLGSGIDKRLVAIIAAVDVDDSSLVLMEEHCRLVCYKEQRLPHVRVQDGDSTVSALLSHCHAMVD